MAFRYYISVKGKTQGQFKGESLKDTRKDKWMEGLHFNMGSSVPVDATSGATKGFRQHQPLVITKEHGAASPQLLQAHWQGEKLTEVIIEMVGRDDGGTAEIVVERITLTEAVIVSATRYANKQLTETVDTDTSLLEDFGFRFSHIMVENVAAGSSTSDDWTKSG